MKRKDGQIISRSLPVTIRKSSDEKSYTFTVSTEAVDRYGEIIRIDGIDTTAYEANPVILFNHSHSNPIGVATNIEKRSGDAPALIAQGVFDDDDPVAALVRSKIDKKHLRAVSIGLMVKKWKFEDEEGNDLSNPEIELSEMIEFSVVSVPANPEALVVSGASAEERRLTRIEALLERLEERTFTPSTSVELSIDAENLRQLASDAAREAALEEDSNIMNIADASAPDGDSAAEGEDSEAAASVSVPVEEALDEDELEAQFFSLLDSDDEFRSRFVSDVRSHVEKLKRQLGQA